MDILTWTCHVCGRERPDDFISVATGKLADLPGAEVNVRYCNDNEDCEKEAKECAYKGNFPKRKETKPSKKWWEFWK